VAVAVAVNREPNVAVHSPEGALLILRRCGRKIVQRVQAWPATLGLRAVEAR
jgi:hypothetical protein